MSVAVVTDSTTYLPPRLMERWGVRQVSLYVGWEGDLRPEHSYDDLDDFYARLRASGEAVTIQLSVQRDPTRALLKADASLTTSSGRIHKSNQTLDVPRTSASEVSEGTTP